MLPPAEQLFLAVFTHVCPLSVLHLLFFSFLLLSMKNQPCVLQRLPKWLLLLPTYCHAFLHFFFLTILFSPPRWRINYIFPTSYGGEKCIYRDFIPTFLPSKKMFSIIFCYFFWGMDTSRELCQLQFEISDIKVQCYLTELPGSLYIDIPVRIKMHFMGDLFSNILLLISIRLAGFFFFDCQAGHFG